MAKVYITVVFLEPTQFLSVIHFLSALILDGDL